MTGSILEANRIFVQTFVQYYFDWNLEKWDTEVPADIAETFMLTMGWAGPDLSVRYLIKDLDAVLSRSSAKQKRPGVAW